MVQTVCRMPRQAYKVLNGFIPMFFSLILKAIGKVLFSE